MLTFVAIVGISISMLTLLLFNIEYIELLSNANILVLIIFKPLVNKKRQINFSTTSLLSENHIKPAAIYANADTEKLQILKDNKEKSGIYR